MKRPPRQSRRINIGPVGARGSALLEVMLAVALVAVTALGLMAGQLAMAREARAMSMRDQAAWIADSLAEAISASAGDLALGQWNARASALLGDGKAAIVQRAGVDAALVTWTATRTMPPGIDHASQPNCGTYNVPSGLSCIALAVSR